MTDRRLEFDFERRVDRRQFLTRTAGAGVAFSSVGTLLAACGGDDDGGGGGGGDGGGGGEAGGRAGARKVTLAARNARGDGRLQPLGPH
jgi:hypothetical protein